MTELRANSANELWGNLYIYVGANVSTLGPTLETTPLQLT